MISNEWFRTKTRSETEAKDNWEMAYYWALMYKVVDFIVPIKTAQFAYEAGRWYFRCPEGNEAKNKLRIASSPLFSPSPQ